MSSLSFPTPASGVIPPAKYFTGEMVEIVSKGLELHPLGPVSNGPARLFIFQKGSLSPVALYSFLARTGVFPVCRTVDAGSLTEALEAYTREAYFSELGSVHFWESSLSDAELSSLIESSMQDFASGAMDSSRPVVLGLSRDCGLSCGLSFPAWLKRIDSDGLPSVFVPSAASAGESWTPAGWPGVPDDGVEGKARLPLHWGWLHLLSSHWFEALSYRLEASEGLDFDNIWKNVLLCCGRYGWDDPRLMSERLGFEIPKYLSSFWEWDAVFEGSGVSRENDLVVCGAMFRGVLSGGLPCYLPQFQPISSTVAGEDPFRFRGLCEDFVIPDREHAHVY